MFQTCPIKESIDSKRNKQKLSECYSSSSTKWFKSFIENLVAYEDDENHREDDISISKELSIDDIESENIIESEE
jgi:hypothetical protein